MEMMEATERGGSFSAALPAQGRPRAAITTRREVAAPGMARVGAHSAGRRDAPLRAGGVEFLRRVRLRRACPWLRTWLAWDAYAWHAAFRVRAVQRIMPWRMIHGGLLRA
jgi:hypothetical protein